MMTLWLILIFFFLLDPDPEGSLVAPGLPRGAVAVGLVDIRACCSSRSRGLDAGFPPPNHIFGFLRLR